MQPTSVLPTVLDLLGFGITGGSYPADSLDDVSGRGPGPIACYVDNRLSGAINGTHKYIFHFGQQPDEYFDLATDPRNDTTSSTPRTPTRSPRSAPTSCSGARRPAPRRPNVAAESGRREPYPLIPVSATPWTR